MKKAVLLSIETRQKNKNFLTPFIVFSFSCMIPEHQAAGEHGSIERRAG